MPDQEKNPRQSSDSQQPDKPPLNQALPDDADETADLPDEPKVADEDTADLVLPTYGEPAINEEERIAELDRYDLPTMPIPLDSESTDPKRTLPGSGGFDPNPDFNRGKQAPREEDGNTVPHIVPFEYTMVHVPGEEPIKRQQPRAGYTEANQPAASSSFNEPTVGPTRSPYQRPQYTTPQAPAQQKAPLPPRRAKKRRILGCSPGCFMIIVGVLVTFCGGLTLITLALSATLGTRLEQQLQAQVANVDTYQNFQSTFFYDRNGRQLYEAYTEGRRTNVAYENFPQDLINATVATEDDSFWSNPGIDVASTARAFLQYVNIAKGESGGSTITQQLVRGVLFNYQYRSERSIQRKVEEIMLAVLLNQRKSKKDVLAMYLNEIYYGNLSYGAEAAAQTLFGKDVGQLTLGESALLAGLPQAPADLNPLDPDPDTQAAVQARWRLVLDRMVKLHYITDAQRNQALTAGLTFSPPDAPLNAPHFTVYAQQELETLMTGLGYTPEDIARGGLKVYTTVDLNINDLAQQAARDQISKLTANNVSNSAIIVLKPGTGEILAMIGSVDYNNDAIDGKVNVTTAPRQPGSTMKPFTYSAGIERGVLTPESVLWDTPTDISGYKPVDYDGSYHGPMRMRTALANSINIAAVQALRRTGVDYLLAIMQRFGVESLGNDASKYGLSLTLGGGEVTLLELTRAYSVFANQGALVPTTSILCVVNSKGDILYQYENSCPNGTPNDKTVNRAGYGKTVLDPRISYIITDILGDNVARSMEMGANSPLNTGNLQTSVKTGTTNDFKDNWTVGYTRNVAVGVWAGNSNGAPMVNSSGLTGAAPIWHAVMTAIYANSSLLDEFAIDGQLQADRPDQPQGMSLHQMCDLNSIKEPATDCSATVREWLLDGPAGVPDQNGQLQFPQQQAPAQQQPPQTGPWLRVVEPDIYKVTVHSIPPDVASQIQFNVQPGQQPPLPPLYCQVPVEAIPSDPNAHDQLFIGPPPDAQDAIKAEQWARTAGIAFLPSIACDATLLSINGGGSPIVITAVISSPTPNQVMPSTGFPIIGTAEFGQNQATYYKIEITGGQFGDQWLTIGSTHPNSVVNNQLEFVQGLQPGNYQIQLIVVGLDGNYVQAPYKVPFTVQ